ncbi:AcrR family transcriptional regulator [Saccharothrix tamanrassetensis]|uniref:AcrR family transcriptional regulator n=1 Tax=Saccharothrix tamanrassetensis TaxID=1051531 RepID=A0A841CS49_9PSEU|nr:TetR/AcrR family transcriptional regulator [Saccharothrix tamanrassetensis]MBB5959693.1 AcrR family transcriptional regulator [Saccharothrix tamanrassetensis]
MVPRRASRGVQRDGSVEVAIVDAVGRILAERSIEDVAVADILGEAGVSRATFYFYFESKHAVVAALFERILGDVYAEFERNWLEVDAAAGDAADSLYTALRAVYRVFLAHGPVLRTVARAYPEQPELAQAFENMMDRLISGATAKIVADRTAGVAPAGHDARELATTLVWMNERCFYVNSLQPDRGWASSDAMIRSLADVWASAIYRSA